MCRARVLTLEGSGWVRVFMSPNSLRESETQGLKERPPDTETLLGFIPLNLSSAATLTPASFSYKNQLTESRSEPRFLYLNSWS